MGAGGEIKARPVPRTSHFHPVELTLRQRSTSMRTWIIDRAKTPVDVKQCDVLVADLNSLGLPSRYFLNRSHFCECHDGFPLRSARKPCEFYCGGRALIWQLVLRNNIAFAIAVPIYVGTLILIYTVFSFT